MVDMTTAGQDQPNTGELVELRQQHDEDQEDCRTKSLAKKGRCFGAVLIRPDHFPADVAGLGFAINLATRSCTIAACTPSLTLACTVMVRSPSMRFSVPTDCAGSRVTKFEIGTEPSGGFNAQLVEGGQRAPILRQPKTNVHSIIRPGRPVVGQLQSRK
jgi:hypothetical protein